MVLAHRLALESEMISADMVEAMEFPDLADRYGVSGVPHTAINDGAGNVIGAVPEEYLLDEIKKALTTPTPPAPNSNGSTAQEESNQKL